MTHLLLVRGLTKSYGNLHAVRGISLEVAEGEIFGLLGPNGAGKTTTLECVIGLRRPDGGSVEIAGVDAVAQPGRARQFIGAQLQATALYDKITPRQALRLFGAFYKRPAEPKALLEQFELVEQADRPFDRLSGGQRQRLALAIALVNQPKVIFFDEPTAGLDPHIRRELHTAIARLKSAGRAIVLTTHYIEEAERLCDRVAIVHRGVIVATGKPGELIAASKAKPSVTIRTARPLTGAQAAAIAGVTEARSLEGGWRLVTESVARTISSAARVIDAESNELLDLQIHRPTLEDVFLEMTGETLGSDPQRSGASAEVA